MGGHIQLNDTLGQRNIHPSAHAVSEVHLDICFFQESNCWQKSACNRVETAHVVAYSVGGRLEVGGQANRKGLSKWRQSGNENFDRDHEKALKDS